MPDAIGQADRLEQPPRPRQIVGTGAAAGQVQAVVERIEGVAARYPVAAAYAPGPIL